MAQQIYKTGAPPAPPGAFAEEGLTPDQWAKQGYDPSLYPQGGMTIIEPSVVGGAPPASDTAAAVPAADYLTGIPAVDARLKEMFPAGAAGAPAPAGAPVDQGPPPSDPAAINEWLKKNVDPFAVATENPNYTIAQTSAMAPLTPEEKFVAALGREPTDAEREDHSPGWQRGIASLFIQGMRDTPIIGKKAVAMLDNALSSIGNGDADPAQVAQWEYLDAQAAKDHPIMAGIGGFGSQMLGYGLLAAVAPELVGGGAVAELAMPYRVITAAGLNGTLNYVDALAHGEDATTAGIVGVATGMIAPGTAHVLGNIFRTTAKPYVTAVMDAAINEFGMKAIPEMAVNVSPLMRLIDKGASLFEALGEPPQKTYAGNMEKLYRGVLDELGVPQGITRLVGDTGASAQPVSVFDTAKKAIGDMYNSVLSRAKPIDGAQYTSGSGGLDYLRARLQFPPPGMPINKAETKAVSNMLDAVQKAINDGGGKLTGDAYHALTRTGSDISRAINSPRIPISDFADRIKRSLEGAFRSANPSLGRDLDAANYRWWALRTAEPLVGAHPDGNYTAKEFVQAVKNRTPNYISGGGGRLGSLARVAEQLLMTEPDPQTLRQTIVKFMTGHVVGKTIASVAGGLVGFHPLTAAAVMAPTMISRGVRRVINSPIWTNKLIQGALNKAPSTAGRVANWALRGPASPGMVSSLVRQSVPLAGHELNYWFGGNNQQGQ